MAKKVTNSRPIGVDPPGTTKAIRGTKDKRAVTDKPMEIPVYITYERHSTPDEMIGWTIAFQAWMSSSRVEIKIGRIPYRMEVWVDGERVAAKSLKRSESDPPNTVPDDPEDGFSTIANWFAGVDLGHNDPPGWVTNLGRVHAALKAQEQRKSGKYDKKEKTPGTMYGRVSGDDIIWDDDDDEDYQIIWEDD